MPNKTCKYEMKFVAFIEARNKYFFNVLSEILFNVK